MPILTPIFILFNNIIKIYSVNLPGTASHKMEKRGIICIRGEKKDTLLFRRYQDIRNKNHLKSGNQYKYHERWDGTGYPDGLKTEDIPLEARIMAVADVYDALISERPYKRAMTRDEAIDIIKKEDGSHFDPDVVRIFLIVV